MDAEKIPAVSVIVPMYNTEKYIGECLQSLLNQTLKNFEVIVVDDCSTDHSFAIAEKMIQTFADNGNILTLIKLDKNSGCPGIPRNVAMDFAKGKYIYFLDSDDFLDETVLENFYNVAEEFKADVVHAEKCFVCEEINGEFVDSILELESTAATEKPTLETFDTAKRMTDFVEKKYCLMIWNKFYRRDFLIENNIKFPAIVVSEDLIFSAMCLSCAKNYVRVPFVGYHYRKRADSATSSPSTVEKSSLDLIEGVYFLDNFMQSKKVFIENPNCRYLMIDLFNQTCADLISKHIFFNMNLEPAEIYAFYRKEIFSLNPQKNIPLTAYLFVSANIYRLFVKQQAAEIAQLKNLVENLK